jgi:hypothetical protein
MPVAAFWRMPCNVFNGVYAMDPLVCPGSIAPHVHTIAGSGAFGTNTTYDEMLNGCTTCAVTQDRSAYW